MQIIEFHKHRSPSDKEINGIYCTAGYYQIIIH